MIDLAGILGAGQRPPSWQREARIAVILMRETRDSDPIHDGGLLGSEQVGHRCTTAGTRFGVRRALRLRAAGRDARRIQLAVCAPVVYVSQRLQDEYSPMRCDTWANGKLRNTVEVGDSQ
jgi:hypothetical protein